MCTVTIVPHEEGVSIGCNRDERLDRPLALPPAERRLGGRRALFPVDPHGGGTWIGANDAGLVLVLLNRRSLGDRRALSHLRRSRGTIVARALTASSARSAVARTARLPLRWFDPYTLIAVQGREVVAIASNGWRRTISVRTLDRPLLYTSSSLGDAVVAAPRRRLFRELLRRSSSSLFAQRAFHRHCWPDRPHVSVLMRRPDAATVSRTWIDLAPRRIVMRYEPVVADAPATCAGIPPCAIS